MTTCPDDQNAHTPPCVYDSPGICFDWTAEAERGAAHRFDDDPDGDGHAPVCFSVTTPTGSGS
jgi:hypothetical protein